MDLPWCVNLHFERSSGFCERHHAFTLALVTLQVLSGLQIGYGVSHKLCNSFKTDFGNFSILLLAVSRLLR